MIKAYDTAALANLKDLVAESSPGPFDFKMGFESTAVIVDAEERLVGTLSSSLSPRQANANAEFFVEARTHLPALIREVERLNFELASAGAEIERLVEENKPKGAFPGGGEQIGMPFLAETT